MTTEGYIGELTDVLEALESSYGKLIEGLIIMKARLLAFTLRRSHWRQWYAKRLTVGLSYG